MSAPICPKCKSEYININTRRASRYVCFDCGYEGEEPDFFHVGFWSTTEDGQPFHVLGDPDMDEETLEALSNMLSLAAKQITQDMADFERLWLDEGNVVRNRFHEPHQKDAAEYWFMMGLKLERHRRDK